MLLLRHFLFIDRWIHIIYYCQPFAFLTYIQTFDTSKFIFPAISDVIARSQHRARICSLYSTFSFCTLNFKDYFDILLFVSLNFEWFFVLNTEMRWKGLIVWDKIQIAKQKNQRETSGKEISSSLVLIFGSTQAMKQYLRK